MWSYMLEYENSKNPFEIRREAIIKWKDIADTHIIENENIIKVINPIDFIRETEVELNA